MNLPDIRHAAPPTSLQRLADVIASLRAPDGCPWDRAQTHSTLAPYAVEETYELVDAIASGQSEAVREELGDLLLQVVLHAQLASEAGVFSLQDVIDGITEKMIVRHPHVFSAGEAADAAAVERTWADAKRREGRGTLDGVPRSMPALERAHRVSVRAARVGFDFPTSAAALAKVDEEVAELHEAVRAGEAGAVESELGDTLFAVANAARKLDVDPERALAGTLERFRDRFAYVEQELAVHGRRPQDATLDELEALWTAAKRRRAAGG